MSGRGGVPVTAAGSCCAGPGYAAAGAEESGSGRGSVTPPPREEGEGAAPGGGVFPGLPSPLPP